MQTIKRRIGIFMHQFYGGGAERMTVILANALYEAGHEVTFIAVSYTHLEPGMLLNAADKYNIDLKNSWMAGDSERDMRAGKMCIRDRVNSLQG